MDHRFNRIDPAFPARWVTAYFVLSSVTGLFATVDLRNDDASQPGWVDASPQGLTPASGRQDHTTSPSATASAERSAGPRAVRQSSVEGGLQRRSSARRSTAQSPLGLPCDPLCAPDAVASTASHRAFVTTRDPPLLSGETARAGRTDLPDGESEIFFAKGLDRFLSRRLICPSGAVLLPPSPRSYGERVGVRGSIREFDRSEFADTPPHPDCISDAT